MTGASRAPLTFGERIERARARDTARESARENRMEAEVATLRRHAPAPTVCTKLGWHQVLCDTVTGTDCRQWRSCPQVSLSLSVSLSLCLPPSLCLSPSPSLSLSPCVSGLSLLIPT